MRSQQSPLRLCSPPPGVTNRAHNPVRIFLSAGSAPTSQPLAQTPRSSSATEHESVLGGASFHFRQLAVKAREPAASQVKPLSKGSRRAAGLRPNKTFGPRPIPLCARPRTEPSRNRPSREQRCLSLPSSPHGAKPSWSRLTAPAAQVLRRPALSPYSRLAQQLCSTLAQALTLAAARPDWLSGLSQACAHKQPQVPQTP